MDINILPYINVESNGISSTIKFLLLTGKPINTTDSIHFSDLSNEVYKIPNTNVITITNAIRQVRTNQNLREQLIITANLYVKKYNWKNISILYYHYTKRIIK